MVYAIAWAILATLNISRLTLTLFRQNKFLSELNWDFSASF